MIPLPEIKVTDKTLPVLESLGIHIDRMIEIQMSAYPECWSVEDRREMACQHLAMPTAPAVAASPSNRFAFRPFGLPSVSQETTNV